MSFDVYLFDMPVPSDDDAISDHLEDDSAWDEPLAPALASAVAELESRFPVDEDDDSDPWAAWPLEASMCHGRCCGLNVRWSAVETMVPMFRDLAARHALRLYDPQGEFARGGPLPTAARRQTPAARRRWWERK